MTLAALPSSLRALIVQHAAILFGIGLIAGLVFTFEVIGHVAAWPLLPPLDFDFPGTAETWKRTHLGLLMNAIAMLAFAAGAAYLRIGERAARWFTGSVLVTGWGNSLGFLTGTLFGVRGLEFGGALANSANYLFFLVAAVSGFIQVGIAIRGAAQARL
jgi:hypothetical protein